MQKIIAIFLIGFWSFYTISGNNLSVIVSKINVLIAPDENQTLDSFCENTAEQQPEDGCCLHEMHAENPKHNHKSEDCSGQDDHNCQHQGNCSRVCCQTITGIRPATIFCFPLPTMHTNTTYPTRYILNLTKPFIGFDFPPPNAA